MKDRWPYLVDTEGCDAVLIFVNHFHGIVYRSLLCIRATRPQAVTLTNKNNIYNSFLEFDSDSKIDPRTERVKIFVMATHNIGIQMKRKEITKTFMMTCCGSLECSNVTKLNYTVFVGNK